jgi:hypothetical protein
MADTDTTRSNSRAGIAAAIIGAAFLLGAFLLLAAVWLAAHPANACCCARPALTPTPPAAVGSAVPPTHSALPERQARRAAPLASRVDAARSRPPPTVAPVDPAAAIASQPAEALAIEVPEFTPYVAPTWTRAIASYTTTSSRRVVTVPEPGSLALMLIGLPLVGGFTFANRRA